MIDIKMIFIITMLIGLLLLAASVIASLLNRKRFKEICQLFGPFYLELYLAIASLALILYFFNRISRVPDTITAQFAVRITAAWCNAVASLDVKVILSSSAGSTGSGLISGRICGLLLKKNQNITAKNLSSF